MRLKTFMRRLFYRRRGQLTYDGLVVPVTSRLITDPILDSLWKHRYEEPELCALSALMRPDDRVLELGLGIGVVSGILARRYPTANFFSYEANSELMPIISHLHRLNGIKNVEVRFAVVAPIKNGMTRRFRRHQHFTESSLVAKSADVDEVEVPVHDAEAVMRDICPDLLICDIEGAEGELIPLLPLSGLRAAVIELHPKLLDREAIAKVFRAFLDAGLVPVVEKSSETVVAFERVGPLA